MQESLGSAQEQLRDSRSSPGMTGATFQEIGKLGLWVRSETRGTSIQGSMMRKQKQEEELQQQQQERCFLWVAGFWMQQVRSEEVQEGAGGSRKA